MIEIVISLARWVVLVLPLAAAIGCGGGGGSDGDSTSVSPATKATPLLVYEDTGHPITATTDDPGVLSRETELETLTNNHRVAVGLGALVSRQDDVRLVSRAHSEHMILHGFFDHHNPEGDMPWDRADRAGISWFGYGENLAGGHPTAEAAFNGFLGSPGHRENIENPMWKGIGCGYAYDGNSMYGYYWTQNFVRP